MEGDNPDLQKIIASLTGLPENLIICILTLLRIKSLIRLRRDFEFLKALFNGPDFLHEHHRLSSDQNPYLVFEGIGLYSPSLCLYKPDQGMTFDKVLIPPLIYPLLVGASYIDSSNGILCIRLAEPTPIVILWNPAIRELRGVDFGSDRKSFKMGFGFSDCKVTDCKVVFVSDSIDEDKPLVRQVDVYSLSTSSWKTVQSGNLLDDVAITSNGKTINGAIFWLGVKSKRHLLVSYDIAKEEFALKDLPVSHEFNDSLRFSVEVHEDKLALLSYTTIGNREYSRIGLWVMEVEGQGWIKKHWIEREFLTRPATIWKNEIVCQYLPSYPGAPEPERESLDEKICLVNLTTGANRDFVVKKYGSGFRILNYVPSLVPVSNEINGSTDEEKIEMLLEKYREG